MILITPVEISRTASGGAWSFNTPKFSGGDLRQIIIKPATATTTYDFDITDEKDNTVYTKEGLTGYFSDLVFLPLRGIYTIAVDTSSVNEAYTGRLLIE